MMITMESIVVVSMMIGRHNNDGGRNNDGRNGEGVIGVRMRSMRLGIVVIVMWL